MEKFCRPRMEKFLGGKNGEIHGLYTHAAQEWRNAAQEWRNSLSLSLSLLGRTR